MTNRELVEKAAAAMGVAVKDWVEMYPGEWWAELDIPQGKNLPPKAWNPLINDGDAFRLMVKLDIDVQNRVLPTTKSLPGLTRGVGVAFVVNDSYVRIVEWYLNDDRAAATRRAITRAAAALQEAKEAT